MTSEPLVSVIVPAYNCVKYIPETLASLFEQDYSNVEIIVVNDGSTDNTIDLLKTYGDKIVIVDQANAGAPGARNNGIRAAKGEFIGFCDSDDLWAPQKVREQVAYLTDHPNVGMVCSSWRVWYPDGEGRFEVPAEFKTKTFEQSIDCDNSGWIYHKLLLDCICLTSAVMFRKEIIEKVGFFLTDLWNGDDYNYWLRTSRITEIHRLKSQRVLYRILPLSVARTPTRIHYEYEVVQNAIAQWGDTGSNGENNDPGLLKSRLAKMRFGFGYLHLKTGDSKIATRCFVDAIKHKPLWYIPWVYLLLGLWKQLIG